MPWTTTHDPEEFLAAAGGFLRSRPVEHNLLLTITERLRRASQPAVGEPPLLGWWADEAEPQGAFSRTAGFPLAVTPMPGEAADELVDVLIPPLPGIGAEVSAAERFARRWQGRTGATVSVHRRQRLYRLGELVPLTRRFPARPGWPPSPTVTCSTPGTMRSWPSWAAPRSGTFPRRSPTGWNTAGCCCGR